MPADQRDKRHTTIERVRAGAACSQAPIRLLLFPSLTTEAQSSVTPLNKASTLQELVDECLSKKYTTQQAQERLFLFLSTQLTTTTMQFPYMKFDPFDLFYSSGYLKFDH